MSGITRMMSKGPHESSSFVPYLPFNAFHQRYKIDLRLRARHYGVVFFWDLENAKAWSVRPLGNLCRLIRTVLKTHEANYYLIRGGTIGFGDLTMLRDWQIRELRGMGIKLQHVGRRTGSYAKCRNKAFESPDPQEPYWCKTDGADVYIIQSMLIHAYKIRAPGNILLASGDYDFATTVADLKDRGFKVMVAVPENHSRFLRSYGDLTWMWDDLIQGGECSFSSPPARAPRPEILFYP